MSNSYNCRAGIPCKSTRVSTREVSFSGLACCMVQTKVQCLHALWYGMCSLAVNEMHIRQKLEYHKQRDAFLGDVNMGQDLGCTTPVENATNLANSLLCCLLCGLVSNFPAGYFFMRVCSSMELAATIVYVIKSTGELGLKLSDWSQTITKPVLLPWAYSTKGKQ